MSNGQALQLSVHDRLVLTTLGRASLECVSESGSRHELLSTGKPLGLVAYLACSPGHSASREHLMDLLWADQDIEAARHSVRQAVWFLRQRLGEHAITATDDQVTLCAAIEADREAFLEAIEHVEFEHALDLYGGDFLPGFAAPGGADFEQWADLERFRLRRMFRRAGETVVRDWMTRGRLRKAKDLAVRLRATDPDDESGWRLELETLLAANDRVGAELAAHRLEEVLARAERPPEPATAGLLALVRQAAPDDPAAASKQSLTSELIGREREFAAILAAWGAARGGLGQHLHITGAAGLGKSRLLADVYARLRSMGGRVVVVRPNPGERSVPYALASELALALAHLPGAAAVSPDSAAALVALNPTLSSCYGVAPDRAFDLEALRRRTIALGELLRAVAEEHPVALLIDDVHWADEASRQILDRLLSLALKHAVLVVTTARPGIAGMVGRVSVEPLALEPLTVDMIGALLASLGRLPAEPWAARFPVALYTPTAGTPLLVLETLNLLLEQGTLTLADGAWSCPDGVELDAMLAQGWPLRRRLAALSRRESWLLVLLATAGAPLPADVLARAAGRDREAVQADLQGLDVRGLVARDGSEWQPAHDEIAARALDGATPGALRSANAILGRLLVATGRDDPGILQRAGRHLAAAGEDQELTRVFRRRLLLQRRRAERRPARAVAADLLGEMATPQRVSRLVHSLPVHVRLGLVTPRRMAAAALGILAVGAALTAWQLRPAAPPPDINLVVIHTVGDSLEARTVALRRDGWESGTALDVSRLGTPYWSLVAAGRNRSIGWVPSPDGLAWAFAEVSGDSGEIDLFLTSPDGTIRRLTSSPGDDGAPSWSPDGRRLVFSTTRGNPDRYPHLALLDVATAGRTAFTQGEPGDWNPHWSPDGTRIAYSHLSLQDGHGAPRICLLTVDGTMPQCHAWGPYTLLGWYDADQLLLAIDTSGAQQIVRLSLNTGETVVVDGTWEGDRILSPDIRWEACRCTRAGLDRADWYVYPTERPDLARRVLLGPDGDQRYTLRWLPTGRDSRYLDHIEIAAAFDTVAAGTEHQLIARGLDPSGAPAPLNALSWRSDDTTIATVAPSSGLVYARRGGTVTVRASAGGWRETAVTLVIGQPPPPHVVLKEDWSGPLDAQWVPFGDPRPEITDGPGGTRAFWNRGDGWYVSGAYARRRFPLAHGLAVALRLSTPVIGPRQQSVHVAFTANLDSAELSRWDHRTGNLPPAGLRSRECGFQYAPGDGVFAPPWTYFDRGTVPLPDSVNSGKWYSLVVQLFPDGRCGIAVDGKPLGITHEVMPPAERYWLVLEGNSVGNRMLAGPLEVWSGVRDDVDWAALRSGATPPPAPSPPSSRLAASPTGSPHTGPSRRTPRRSP
ncbi:MAG TPA: AAA family ATPase [Gemmatimonadales bacterium]|nr:AAA family ATPase [Gemmatimonadales bacterium]